MRLAPAERNSRIIRWAYPLLGGDTAFSAQMPITPPQIRLPAGSKRGCFGLTLPVEPAPHEFAANSLFDEGGLAPFFAANCRVKSDDGSQYGEFTIDG